MKKPIRNLFCAAMLIAASLQIHAQGLVYDQQSTNPPSILGDYLNIQEDSPLTQSFIPALSTIGFVQFEFWDIPNNGTNGATVSVKLWTGSSDPRFGATLLGSTTPVYMPNGFGSTSPGVTIFYFSTLVALIPGQTYYLQPVVLSGDDPWDIWDPGDTYSDGQLFEGGAGFSKDLWFGEGIVVPEPSAYALIGLGSLLFFGFKRRSKLPVLFLVGVLLTVPVLSVHSAPYSVIQATADEVGLTSIATTALPESGTFWVMTVDSDGNLIESPYPDLPDSLSALPIYSITNDIYMVDDTGGQLAPASAGRMSNAQTASIAQTQAATTATLIQQILYPADEGDQPDGGFTPMVYTNGLWLEIINKNPTNLWLRLHGTVGGDNYQLLSITNLSNTNWNLGQILFYASDGYADFSSVPMTNAPTFFRAHHANPVMQIVNYQDSEELNPTNTSNPGQIGVFYIENETSATNDLTVYYSIGGTAQNGIDYSNLTGTVTVPVSQGYAEIDIDPTADGLKPNQTIILTLTQNTNYLIDPAYDSATNTLIANPQVYPTINGDNERICPNTSLPIDLTNDVSDPRGLPLHFAIQNWPVHGTLFTNNTSTVTYTGTNCYEGLDSFTYTASDGQYASTGLVTLVISDPVSAYPVSAQTCRGTPVQFSLNVGDGCSQATNYSIATPLNGSVSNVSGRVFIYTPNSTNYTGTNTFNYTAYNGCGDSASSTVTITVGDINLQPNSQNVMTGTNRPVAFTLIVTDNGDGCTDTTNYYTYTLTSSPTNGYLTGTPPNLTYTPTNGERVDNFNFNVSDGVWPSAYPDATVTIYTVAGPVLFTDCDPFGTAVELDWSLDTNVQQDDLNIIDYIIYRSAVSGGTYTAIATNTPDPISGILPTIYFDTNTVVGQTNYYVVTFQTVESGVTNESPRSNQIKTAGQNPGDLILASAFWDVVTNFPNQTNVTRLQAPFSSFGTNQYYNLYPLPNSFWPVGITWSNHIALVIPTNSVNPALVQYSIAIDNDYYLYLNGAFIEHFSSGGQATWSSFKTFNSVAPGNLHSGTNNLGIVIIDEGEVNYFSMVVTTNTCGQ